MWNSCQSTYFRLNNWVKHGGVFAATLFNWYIDILFIIQDSDVIHGTHMVALSYADDITLSAGFEEKNYEYL